MQKYFIEEVPVEQERGHSKDKEGKMETHRVFSDLDDEDDVSACLLECTQDVSMMWFHTRERFEDDPEEYEHLADYTTLCIPVRSYPERDVMAVLQLEENVFNHSLATGMKEHFQKTLLTFCDHISGPLEMACRHETNQILSMRRYTARTQNRCLGRTFARWKREHEKIVEGREQRTVQVAWGQKIKQKHQIAEESHIIHAWTRFLMRSRGQKIREYQIELEDIRRRLPAVGEDDL